MFMRRLIYLLPVLLVAGVTGGWSDENEWFKPLGAPPKASPRHISGGEGVPPLPLPASTTM